MIFKVSNQEQAQKELDCFFYLLNGAKQAAKENEFGTSVAYLENAIRSLEELQAMKKEEKEIRDEIAELLSKASPETIKKFRRYLV